MGELKGIKVAGQYGAITGYGLLIGRNIAAKVSHAYKPPSALNGTLDKVTVELK